ncbi:hypothetical protein BU197_20495 [Streptomyces sp. CBMA291]|nr:hypothetical protein [Streptomyces sp. CBMA291]MBD0715514.1 hypothetical protein [Streptomyces sp. CBMA370]
MLRTHLTYWGCLHLADTAELLATELLTNAFRHANAPRIGVRVRCQGRFLCIEVDDGCPGEKTPVARRAALDAEDGRGLFLLDALADDWGRVRATTWCHLSLAEAPSEEEPAPVATAPQARHEAALRLPSGDAAPEPCRLADRTRPALRDWPGDLDATADVTHILVRNALEHGIVPGVKGQEIAVRLRVAETEGLLIEVSDPNPEFPGFGEADERGQGRGGLWDVKRLGAALTWFPDLEGGGKTVRATLRPGRTAPER